MKIQTQFLTTNNSYDVNEPYAIVVHNTDNYAATANAKAHAEGLKNGYMQGMSWHFVTDDKAAYQCLPYNRGAWHIGVNYGNAILFGKINNRNSICVEMCVNAGCDYEKAFLNTVDVVKHIMAEKNIPADRVYQHYDICNKNCPSMIRAKGDWGRFKKLIGASGTDTNIDTEPVIDKIYRVRKSWEDSKSQTNAFRNLDLAKADADRHPGYSVYDWNGKAVYTSTDANSGAQPSKYPSGVPASKEAYIESVGTICRELQKETGILASVVAAQCCLETGFGLDPKCKKNVEHNNLLGMKTDLINGTWSQWSVWKGGSFTKPTNEDTSGGMVEVEGSFRAYDNYEQCIRDYEMFLLHVRNDKGYKYASVQGMTDEESVIRKIWIGTGTPENREGYATDRDYPTKVLKVLRENNLTRFNANASDIPANATITDRYEVGHVLNDPHRLGLFHVLMNAEKLADLNWGYYVFDIVTGKQVYNPDWNIMQRFVSELVYMDLLMKDDISNKKAWKYKNKNTSSFSKTFDEARANNNRYTNCVSGVQWALLRAGLPRKAIQWYGYKGIVWVGADAEKNAKKYFDIITVNKTVKTAVKDGTIQPGDILTYSTIGHTNAYIANGVFFDAGHAYCDGSGEGAKFKSWTGASKYNAYKVAKILRLKQ